MLKPFLVAYDITTIGLSDIPDQLNKIQAISNWQVLMPGVVVVITASNVHEITVTLNLVRPNTRFVVAELDMLKVNGRLEPNLWNFMQRPQPYIPQQAPPKRIDKPS